MLPRSAGAAFSVVLAAGALVPWLASPAFGHASERGHVLLLPTGYYMAGGALAVALSFAVLAMVPAAPLERAWAWRAALFVPPRRLRLVLSWLFFLFLAGLVACGWLGSRDPLANPLPLVFWALLWGGMALVQGLLGDLWWWINPWYGPCRLLALLPGLRHEEGGKASLPARLGYGPAVVLFFAFAWFELVYPAPEDPSRLATVLAAYFLVNLAAAVFFGHAAWMRRGECLSALFTLLARLAMFSRRDDRPDAPVAFSLPAARLATAEPLPLSGVAFLLLALSTVSFDGLMRTFFWLGRIGVNPLEFPGRSAVAGASTLGLLAMALLLVGAFLAAIRLGEGMARSRLPFATVAGTLAWTIMPISLAYHFAHNLTLLLVNAQYALVALSDPLGDGRDLLGTAHLHVHAGVVSGHESAWVIWNAQASAIVGGHVLAVLAAHAAAHRLHGPGRRTLLGQVPLAVLMVAYTVFGLWLLASPTGA